MKKAKYTEPADFIPKSIRKELKLGEFYEEDKKKEGPVCGAERGHASAEAPHDRTKTEA